jgi:hypothetical protein
MKKITRLVSNTKKILVMSLVALLLSCSKKKDTPSPATTTTPTITTSTTNTTTTPTTPAINTSNAMCGDSICKLPFKILSVFLPSGFYNTGEQTTALLIDSCGETPAYPGEGLRIKYTHTNNYWGAHFLNNNNWAGTFKVTPSASKITFYIKVDYSANVTFNAFGDAMYGKIELYKKANTVTPVWEKITIPLLGKPATFSAPLNIIIDGVTQAGKVTIVDIKDVLIE